MKKCMVCGSDNVLLWLGGSIGTLYYCTDCHFIGPVVLNVQAGAEDRVNGPRNPFRVGTFWSETGIGNRSFFET